MAAVGGYHLRYGNIALTQSGVGGCATYDKATKGKNVADIPCHKSRTRRSQRHQPQRLAIPTFKPTLLELNLGRNRFNIGVGHRLNQTCSVSAPNISFLSEGPRVGRLQEH